MTSPCIICGRRGQRVPMPLTGTIVPLCNRCRGAAFIREMRRLVAHG